MYKLIMKLLFGRAVLLLLVDTTDKDDIRRAIARLEHIRDGVVPTAEEEKRQQAFAGLHKPFDHQLTLTDTDGRVKPFRRADHPKQFEVLDYLYDHPEAESISVRDLEEILDVSKSLVQVVKQYWAIEENRKAFAAFREQEAAGTPF